MWLFSRARFVRAKERSERVAKYLRYFVSLQAHYQIKFRDVCGNFRSEIDAD
ncbi:MAG: hypothetical protein U5L45_24655 [Saprospiraceae bacterium]|nr:hypothetical protein [Saprospiraceae bacterium]